MAREMLAVVKQDGKTALRQVPVPVLRGSSKEAIVRVMRAGICRTDLLAADNAIDTSPTLVLGHEFSGIIESIGNNSHKLREGDRVAVNPVGSCKTCERCRAHNEMNCLRAKFLGLRADGGFAEFVRVAQAAVVKLPQAIPFVEGVEAAPIAAGLAVLNAGIRPDERGLICGTNRIAKLIQRILAAKGFRAVECAQASQDPPPAANRYDFAIETDPNPLDFAMMLKAIRPGGKIILRSRVHRQVEFPLQAALSKEPVIHVVHYGSFQEAVELLTSRAVDLSDLLGQQYALGAFEEAFATARNGEAKKLFLAIGE